jgi:hypothetical protein
MSDDEQWQIVDDYMSEKGFFDTASIINIQKELDDRTKMKHEIVANACECAIHAKKHGTYDKQQKWIRENKDDFEKSNNKSLQRTIEWLENSQYEWFLVTKVICTSIIAKNARKAAYMRDTTLGKLPPISEETHFVLMRACLQRMMQIRNEISQVET